MMHKVFLLILLLQRSISSLDIDDNGNENFEYKISYIHDLILNKNWNCTDVIAYFQQRAYKYNPIINAIISYNPQALQEAARIDDAFYGQRKTLVGKLHCVPVLVKDNVDVANIPTTGGLRAFNTLVPKSDAVVVGNLKHQGAIVIAKANLAEMGFGFYASELGGACRNPWNTDRSCGRSSSGTAAGIASGLAIIGIGTDTSGSIMYPASVCGVYGIRPLKTAIDFTGIMPIFKDEDTVGPMAKYVEDLVLAYSVISGNSTIEKEFQSNVKTSTDTIRLGYLDRFWTSFSFPSKTIDMNYRYSIDSHVLNALNKTLISFQAANLSVTKVSMTNDEIETIFDLYEKILISHVIENCRLNCFKKVFEKYLENFEHHEFRSFDDLANSSAFTKFWQDKMKEMNTENSTDTCDHSCKNYFSIKEKFVDLVQSWFSVSKADVLLFPAIIDLPYEFNNDNEEDINNVNPIFLPVYSNYPSIIIPIDLSDASLSDNIKSLPIGMMMITNRNALDKGFKIAKLFEKLNPKASKAMPLIRARNSSNMLSICRLFFSILLTAFAIFK